MKYNVTNKTCQVLITSLYFTSTLNHVETTTAQLALNDKAVNVFY